MQIKCKFFPTFIWMIAPSLILTLDTRRAKKDGSYPLVLRISFKGRTSNIRLGYDIPQKDWDAKRRKVRKSFSGVSSVSRLNHELLHRKTEAWDKIKELEEQGILETLSVQEVKQFLIGQENTSSFLLFTEHLIEDLRKVQRFGNAATYTTALGVLRNFLKEQRKKELEFKDITYSFLKKFENWHLAKGNAYNSLSVYLRTIRAIYNKAIKAGLVERDRYPFDQYKIKHEPTQKRAISLEDFQKVIQVELEPGTHLFDYRNYFLASYMLWGISFMDLAFLRIENIINGRIKYRRMKTSKLYDIPLSDQLSNIIDYYADEKKNNDFIFPIIKREDLEDQYRDIKWARKRYNKGLQEIQEICCIEEKLTSYVIRHSFATQALLKDVPIKAISEMLGHSRLSTTEVYLKSLPTKLLDEFAGRLKI